ncbi:MAG: ribonuclease E inhibitor RraB, partial [Gaiellaceae bacterium]
ADSLALRQLAGRGADLAKPRHVIHFLYFADENDARTAADALAEATWRTSVQPPTETVAQWCVQADAQRTVGPDTVPALRSWFENVAAEHHGEYDGWEAASKP